MLSKEFIGKGALVDLFGKEKVKEDNINHQMLGMMEVMLKDIAFMKQQQNHQLSEQEIQKIKLMSIEEVANKLMDNQVEMKKSIDTLVERWG